MEKASEAKSVVNVKKRRDLAYYILLLFFPFLQFFIFYVVVNFNSIVLSFERFELDGYSFKYVYGGFENYAKVISDIFHDETMGNMLKNSGIAYLSGLLITTPLALFFSYYVMKKFKGSAFFRVILFLPTIISAVITLFMFKIICDNILPELINLVFYRNSPVPFEGLYSYTLTAESVCIMGTKIMIFPDKVYFDEDSPENGLRDMTRSESISSAPFQTKHCFAKINDLPFVFQANSCNLFNFGTKTFLILAHTALFQTQTLLCVE